MSDSTIVDLRYHLIHPTPPDTGQPDRYIAGKNLCFVRLETADGLHGWGECYTQSDRDIQITAHLEAMRRYIVGWDSTRIKPWTDAIHNDFGNRRGAMDLYSAISGVEQAMWDLVGKRAGMPVHQLLGGAVRDRLRVYANGWAKMDDLEELQARARAMVDRGFTALKFDPVPGRWRSYVGMKELRLAADRVRAVREAVGPDVDVLLEIHRRLSPSNAVRLSKMVEEYEPFWFEEPVWAENMTALASATAQINIPTVTGEELYTKFEFREAFEQRAADIINPDVANVGGIKELTEIAAMAEIYFVAVAPAQLQLNHHGARRNTQCRRHVAQLHHHGVLRQLRPWGQEAATPPFEVEDSHIQLPATPGLGIDLDEEALRAHPAKDFPARTIGD